jgi:predicted nucleic acid-binding protein
MPVSAARVVVDTNVFVAAGFNPHSASAQIVDVLRRGQLQMVWNDATRLEIERILQQIAPLRTLAVADVFRPAHHFSGATHPERFVAVSDPDDRKFAALAYAAGATLISNDQHLLRVHDRLEVPVLTPGAFWHRHRQ